MLRIYYSVIALALLSGCASQGQPTSAFATAKPGCQSETREIAGQVIKTDFCIHAIPFKPSQYLVRVNDETAFQGDDYQRVVFHKTLKNGTASGSCYELIELRSGTSESNVELAQLSSDLIQGCAIKADSQGRSMAFEKTPECDKAFYPGLLPLLGKVVPVETARQCSVSLDGKVVFSGNFHFQ